MTTTQHFEPKPFFSKSEGQWIYLGPRDRSGKRVKMRGPREKTGAARATFVDKIRRQVGVTNVRSSAEPLQAFLDDYAEQTVRNNKAVSPTTRSRYQELMPHVAALGRMRLRDVTADDISKALDALGTKARTAKAIHTFLRAVFRLAVSMRKLTDNPMNDVPVPNYEIAVKPRTFSRTEVGYLKEAAKGNRLEALLLLLVTYGMRPAEVYGLRRCDLTLHGDEPFLSVNHDLVASSATGWVPTLGPLKTKTSRRDIYLGASLVAALRDRCKAGLESPFVFTSRDGQPIRHSNLIRRWWRPLLRAAAKLAEEAARKQGDNGYRFPKLHMYSCRHTAAELMVEAGLPADVVAAILGHATAATTLKYYRNVSRRRGVHAAKILDSGYQDEQLDTKMDTSGPILALPAPKAR